MALGRRRRRPGADRLGARAAALRHAPVAAGHARRLPARRSRWRAPPARAIVLDIDYRPVLWGLTAPGLGEQRYVASERGQRGAAAHRRRLRPLVGTEEEIRIAGGSRRHPARRCAGCASSTAATLVVKRGPMGCIVFAGAIPDDIEARRRRPRLSGRGVQRPRRRRRLHGRLPARLAARRAARRLLRLRQRLRRAGRLAPRLRAGDAELDRAAALPRPRLAASARSAATPTLEHLHRATTRLRRLAGARGARLRPPHPARGARRRARRRRRARASPASRRCSPTARGAAPRRAPRRQRRGFGVIVDDRYGEDVLPTLTGSGGWIARPVEQPGSRPLAFEAGADVALALRAWPTEHVAKCLVSYHPDDDRPSCARRSSRGCSALQRGLHRHRPRAAGRGDPAARGGELGADTLARALGRRSTPPACAPTGGSCRRPSSDARMGADRRRDRAPRSALPRRPPARPRGERGRRWRRSFATAAPHALLQGLRRRPLDLRRRGGGLVRRQRERRGGRRRRRRALRAAGRRSGAGPAAPPRGAVAATSSRNRRTPHERHCRGSASSASA